MRAAASPRTALIIHGSFGSCRMSLLNVRKNRRRRKSVPVGGLRWSAADVRDLEETVELARVGVLGGRTVIYLFFFSLLLRVLSCTRYCS